MGRAPHKQTSFAGGEIGSAFWGRTDIDRYRESARLLRNVFITPQGALVRRWGSQWLGTTKANDGSYVRLFGAEVGLDQSTGFARSFILEFGNTYVRFWRNGANVSANAGPAWSAAGVYVVGQVVSDATIGYRCNTAVGPSATHPAADGAHWTAIGGGVPLEVPTVYTGQTELQRLKIQQSGSTILITSQNGAGQPRAIQQLQNFGNDADWRLNPYATSPSVSAPGALALTTSTAADATHPAKNWGIVVTAYVTGDAPEESIASNILTPGGGLSVYPDRPATYGWTAVAGVAGYFVYRGQGGAFGYIGTTNTNSFRDDGQDPLYSVIPPSGRNPFDTSPSTDPNRNPAACMFHSERAWFANSFYSPSTLWSTRIAALHSFDRGFPATATDAMQNTLSTRKFEEIRGMADARALFILTSGGVWAMQGVFGAPPSPTAYSLLKAPGDIGASWVDPLIVDDSILYVADRGGHVREVEVDVQGNFKQRDLSLFNPDIVERDETPRALGSGAFLPGAPVEWCYTRHPLQSVWVVRKNGALGLLSYSKETGRVAWSTGYTGSDFAATGAGSPSKPDPVLSICSVSENGEDVVYIAVSRVGPLGFSNTYVERIGSTLLFSGATAPSMVVNMDAASVFLSPVTAVTTFTLLYGPRDSNWQAIDPTTTPPTIYTGLTKNGSDQVILPQATKGVYIGRSISSRIELLDLGGDPFDQKSVTRVELDVIATAGFFAGQSVSDLAPWRAAPGDATDTTNQRYIAGLGTLTGYTNATGLYEGKVDASVTSGFNRHGRIIISETRPIPFCILAVTREVEDVE